jgi:SAM-dependent methyltransferase
MVNRPKPTDLGVAMSKIAVERGNRIAYSVEENMRVDALSGFNCAGESAALVTAAGVVRGTPILDIGVGAGRTVELMALLSDDYTGIDYVAARVANCRRRFPTRRFEEGDARALRYADEAFGLTLFSFNGIDTLDHEDRMVALLQMRRVTSIDGLVVFSTLNINGGIYREKPWQTHPPGQPVDRSARAAAHLALRNARDPGRFARRLRNYRATAGLAENHPGWGMAALSFLDFTVVNHFTSLSQLHSDLVSVMLSPLAIYGTEGDGVTQEMSSDTANFHVVARRLA